MSSSPDVKAGGSWELCWGWGLLPPPGTRSWQERDAASLVNAGGVLGDQLVNVCTVLLIHKEKNKKKYWRCLLNPGLFPVLNSSISICSKFTSPDICRCFIVLNLPSEALVQVCWQPAVSRSWRMQVRAAAGSGPVLTLQCSSDAELPAQGHRFSGVVLSFN